MHHPPHDENTLTVILWLAGAGLLIGLGKLLAEGQNVTLKVAFGRCIVSTALGAASALLLAFLPEAPLEAVVGLGCAIASIGTSGLERLLTAFLSKGASK